MERGTAEMIKMQIEIKEALEAQKLKELELIRADLKVLRLQLKSEGFLEEEISKKENSKWYAVFNGPFPGIYDNWSKAAPNCQGISGVQHRAFPSKEEAEKAMKEYSEEKEKQKGKEIYLGPRTFSETIKTSPFPVSPLKVLGKLPTFTFDDFKITSRREHESHVQFSEEGFQNYLKRLANWSENEKVNCFYMVDRKIYGLKAVLLPGAPATLAYNLFQYGFVDNMYLSSNLEELNLFPHYFKEAVQMFKKNVAKDRGIFLKYFSAYPDFITKQSAKHLVYIGISNNSFPLKDEPTGIIYDEDQITSIIINQLASIFSQCQSIGKESFIKALYKGKNTLLLSKTAGKVIKEKDIQLLTGFELPFYAFQGQEMNYRPAVLKGLCQKIKESDNHACEGCTGGKVAADTEDDKESVDAIIED